MGTLIVKVNESVVDEIELPGIKIAVKMVKESFEENYNQSFEFSTVNPVTRIENITKIQK
jgi:hypothetical protein